MREELKLKDVMCGDWVDVRNDASPDTPHIEKITPSHLLRDEHWYGIGLTPEILEKNDFEKNWQDNYEYFDDDGGLNITFHPKSSNYTNGAYDYIDIERGCLTINEMPITFIHELQHVLVLCESKKEIIL